MVKDPYREMAEKNKKPLTKVEEDVTETDFQTLKRPVKEKDEKKRHYPLLTVMLIFFIASPFLAVYVFKEDKTDVNQVITEKNETADENQERDTE
ncbi:hypothetical protein [Domibacillus epiphyticus]|uniref:Uncharacterized protein n=1 Tax=Domibacillus epiphyticus TaxID=1714355 RepID=A0A1V2A4F8_9BACI|nr:hypothetical protein [Domibacillus epiphyticus]OMP65885.1 hypothetical protein BTO28_15125 [Domibacillus epiphyticus]